jgi:DNA polymerase-1
MKADTLIVDGRHALWRTSDAFKMLSAELGDQIIGTGGMYGFLCLMTRIHQKYGGKTIVAWEGSNNFRRELYPQYKEKTAVDQEQLDMIEDMREQEKRLKAMLRALGVRQYYGDGCEADDVIGRLSKEYSADEDELVIIYSGDSDLRQLVKENVVVAAPGYRGAKDVIYDQERVLEKHKVIPGYIADLKALSGDSSDNIPGVKGIGPVWASKLINSFGNVEKIIKAASGESEAEWPLSERFKDLIRSEKDNIRLYKELTTIRTSMPMKAIKPKPNREMLIKHFKAYHFASLLAAGEMFELSRLADGE